MRSAPLIVMVTGAVPGLGKSSLCRRVAAALEATGHGVERFDEEDIVTSDVFEDVIATYRLDGRVPMEVLLEATKRYVAAARRHGSDVSVQDMLFPYLPSLLSWGYSDTEILGFFDQLVVATGGAELLQVHLEGDAWRAIERARQREGGAWLEAFRAKVNDYADGDVVVDLDSLIEYLESAQARTGDLLRRAPWPVHVLRADRDPDAVAESAMTWLQGTMS